MNENTTKTFAPGSPEGILQNIVFGQLKGKFGYSDDQVSRFLDETIPLETRLEDAKIEQKVAKDKFNATKGGTNTTVKGDTLSDDWTPLSELPQKRVKFISEDPNTMIQRYLFLDEEGGKHGCYIEVMPSKGNVPLRVKFDVNPHIPALYKNKDKSKETIYDSFNPEVERIVSLLKEVGNTDCLGTGTEKYHGRTGIIFLFMNKLYASGHTVRTNDDVRMKEVIMPQLTVEMVKAALKAGGIDVKDDIPYAIMGEFYGPGCSDAGNIYISGKKASCKLKVFDIRIGFHDGSTMSPSEFLTSEEDKAAMKWLKIGSDSEGVYGWTPKDQVKKVVDSLIEQGAENIEFVRVFKDLTLNEAIIKVINRFKSDTCYRDGVNLGPCEEAYDAEGIVWEAWVGHARVQIKIRRDNFDWYKQLLKSGEKPELHTA